MKADEIYDKVTTEKKEVVVPLQNNVTYQTIGCEHYFIQKTATSVQCTKCKLGLYGAKAENGKIVKG